MLLPTLLFLTPRLAELESTLLRPGATTEVIARCCEELCASGGGVDAPALSPLIEGEWTLVDTSKSSFDPRAPLGARSDGSSPGLEALFPGAKQSIAASSSPIQRALLDAFSVTQTIELSTPSPRVTQTVALPGGARLVLGAIASTSDAAPSRVSFRFDEGFLQSGNLRLPYPVPFRLLPEAEASGWLDTLYLSESLRISVGNKGTTFVLRRSPAAPAA